MSITFRWYFKIFYINNWKKAGLKVTVKVFSVDYNSINASDILDIHRDLLKET